MAVGCGAKFAKVMLIIFNIIFLCSGVVLMALGIWLLVTLSQSYGPSQVFSLASGSGLYRDSAILLLAMGCFILVFTVFGLIAAIRESAILLSIYAVLLFLIFAGEIAGGVVAIVYKDRIIESLSKTLDDSISQFTINKTAYYSETSPRCTSSAAGRLWDYVQIWFNCCGIDEYYDSDDKGNKLYNGYRDLSYNECNATAMRWPDFNGHVPLTCCMHSVDFSDFMYDDQGKFLDKFNCSSTVPNGCMNSISNWITKYAPILIGIGLGFGMMQLFGFIFVICLCMNTDKGFKRF